MNNEKKSIKAAKEIILRTLAFHSEKSYAKNVLLAMVQDVASRIVASKAVDELLKSRKVKINEKGLFSIK
jgi:hypothetical protein